MDVPILKKDQNSQYVLLYKEQQQKGTFEEIVQGYTQYARPLLSLTPSYINLTPQEIRLFEIVRRGSLELLSDQERTLLAQKNLKACISHPDSNSKEKEEPKEQQNISCSHQPR